MEPRLLNDSVSRTPLISVCIPTYNGSRTLRRAIQSCADQTYSNLEVIVIDDKSLHDPSDIINEFRGVIQRLVYLRNTENIGLMPNFFKAFREASGEFIQPLADDDWLASDYMSVTVQKFLELPEVGAVSTRLESMRLDGDKIGPDTTIAVRDGFWNVRHIAHHIYSGIWGSANIFCLFRRTELLRAITNVEPLFQDSNFGAWYRKGFTTDWSLFLEVIANAPVVFVTNETSYMKSVHERNAGKEVGGLLTTPQGVLEYHRAQLRCLTPLYERAFGRVATCRLRTFFATSAFGTLMFRLGSSTFRNAFVERAVPIRALLEEFRWYEQIFCILRLPFHIISRLIRWLARRRL